MAFSGSGAGTEGDPYQITTWGQLQEMNDFLVQSVYFKLMNDLNSSTGDYDDYASSSANAGAGWLPIGADYNHRFLGSFDGNNKTISDLYISRSGTDYIGLFGYCHGTCSLSDVGFENVDITGRTYTGALVGAFVSSGNISQCYSKGTISGLAEVGGLIGANVNGAVSNCYSTASSTSTDNVCGGFSGHNGGTITNSYSTGSVVGGGVNIGGFLGSSTGTETNCFWDTQTSGQATSGGSEIGKTTQEMKSHETFPEWDILNVEETQYTYPYLAWEDEASSSVWRIVSNSYIVMRGTKGTRFLNTNWPIEEGLVLGTTKISGRVCNLVPEKSFVSRNDRIGLD